MPLPAWLPVYLRLLGRARQLNLRAASDAPPEIPTGYGTTESAVGSETGSGFWCIIALVHSIAARVCRCGASTTSTKSKQAYPSPLVQTTQKPKSIPSLRLL